MKPKVTRHAHYISESTTARLPCVGSNLVLQSARCYRHFFGNVPYIIMAKAFTSIFSGGLTGGPTSFSVRRGGNDRGARFEDTPFPVYVNPLLHRECAIEFVDWRWLCSHCLDSEAAALEYFYLSPFYAQRDSFCHAQQETLNERMRRGEHTDTQGFDVSQQQGLLFSVTYSNLSSLRKQAPRGVLSSQEKELEKRETETKEEKKPAGTSGKDENEELPQPPTLLDRPTQEVNKDSADFVARCNYFNTYAIFHITLFRREPARHGAMLTLPLRVYAVIGGKIYRMAPLMEVLQQKMASAMQHLERCFDLLQLGLVRWDLNEGYVWWARLPQEDERNKSSPISSTYLSYHSAVTTASENTISKTGGPAGAEHEQDESSSHAPFDASALSCRDSAAPSEVAQKKGSVADVVRSRCETTSLWMRRAAEWVEEEGCLVKEVFKKTHCEVASRVLAAEQKRLASEIQNLLEKRKRNEEQWKGARELEVALAAAISKKLVLYRQYKNEKLKQLPFSQQLRILQLLQNEGQQQAERKQQAG